MGAIVVYALVAIAIAVALVALFVVVLPDDQLSRPVPDVVPTGLPVDREVGADDLNRLRLPVSVRGYRMLDADVVFDRLSAEIERRDQEIAELRMANSRLADARAFAPAESDRRALNEPERNEAGPDQIATDAAKPHEPDLTDPELNQPGREQTA